MTVKEYNRDLLPRIQRAKSFVQLLEYSVQQMDGSFVDKNDVRKHLQILGWSEEMRRTIHNALTFYDEFAGRQKIEADLGF